MIPTRTKQKTAQQIFQDAWIGMHRHAWLFPQNFDIKNDKGEEISGPASSEEYLNEFANQNRLFLFRCPSPYAFEIVVKYREKVALSGHISSGTAIVPYTVFQLDGAKMHAIADWIWDTDETRFIFALTIFVTNQLDYIKFMEDNREFECESKEPTMGFAAAHGDE